MIKLIDFFANWCGPCRMMTPVIEKITTDNPDITVEKVDIDIDPVRTQQNNIRGVPTFIIEKDGVEIWRQSGTMGAAHLQSAINQAKA
jgi:thioredoxin 1